MEGRDEPLPDDIEALKAALVIERGKRIAAETDAAFAKARAIRRPGVDRPSEAADRETQPRPLWPALGAHRAAIGSARIDAGGTGELGDRGRTCRRNGRGQNRNHEGGVVHAQAAVTQAVPGSSASRAGDHAGTCGLRLLWRRAAVQARRGHHRDAGGESRNPGR